MPNSSCIDQLQQKVYRRGVNYELNRLDVALQRIHNPHHNLPPVIHIAGTNGKGSVAHYLTQALCQMGHSVFTYTSPHIHHYTERFKLNGTPLSDDQFTHLFQTVAPCDPTDTLSEYEYLTIMALAYAQQHPIDYCILETGLGGRLDATNVVPESVSIITDIGLDHTDILGNTLHDIATEKAGIIKPNSTIITHADHPTVVTEVIKSVAKAKQATIEWTTPCTDFDARNRALSQRALMHLHPHLLDDNHIQSILPPYGRLTPLTVNGTPIWIDVGHNASAVMAILAQQLPISEWIIGMQKTKDYVSVITTLLNHHQTIKLCEFDSTIGVKTTDLPDAILPHVSTWHPGDLIAKNTLFFGSFYWIDYLHQKKVIP